MLAYNSVTMGSEKDWLFSNTSNDLFWVESSSVTSEKYMVR